MVVVIGLIRFRYKYNTRDPMPCVFTVQVVRSSHAFHLFLYSFPSFVHNIDQVGIHQVDDKICTQNGEQCQQEDTHEKVLVERKE